MSVDMYVYPMLWHNMAMTLYPYHISVGFYALLV